MFEEFQEWLKSTKPKSARHYTSGFNTINRICSSASLEPLENWTIENWDSYYDLLNEQEEYKELNRTGKNILSATLNNIKLFLNNSNKITIPPAKPFEEFKWRWASKTPSEGINNRPILFGVLSVLVKHNGKKHATQAFRDDLIKLEDELQSKISLSKKDRGIEKNIIENSGQYWKAYGLLNTTSDGTINVSEFGLKVINENIDNESFVRWQIKNFYLPNTNVETSSIVQKHNDAEINIKPLELLFKIFSHILAHSESKNQEYITIEEVEKVIVPLSVNSNIPIDTYVEHIFNYREDESEYASWPNYTPEANDKRMLNEYFAFLKNFGAIAEYTSKEGNRYYFNDMTYRLLSDISKSKASSNTIIKANNIIYFGSPGTGKSNTVDEVTKGKNVRKVTFHPEYDYHSFVGGYKPSMEGESITYTFVPQIFTNVYVEAWKNPDEHYYLQIEEINRGNCAEIFGDLFQLLDRDNEGSSKYDVDANQELAKYLTKKLPDGNNGIVDGKIKLPNNLSIIATMNTSDQSLFPMDSAFKRRWDWEYMKIDYSCDKSNFTLKLNNGNTYEWLKFLKAVNRLIFETTGSPDKQIGNWFVNPTDKIIDEKMFINKALFYLWNDVFKDEDESLFNVDGRTVTYEDFFTEYNTNSELIVKIIDENLQLENKTIVNNASEIVELDSEESSTPE